MRSAKRSSRTTPSNRWMQCTTSLRRRRSTSNVIKKSSNPSLPSPTSSSHHDMEMVLDASADCGREIEVTVAGMTFPFFTLGHSTRPLGEFIDLLAASEVGLVVDVRTVPRSRTNPQYDREALPGSLSAFQIAYEHVAELGGRRARAKNIAPEVNAFWGNQSFHNYADYAMGSGFRSGLARLRELGPVRRCAVMC